MRSMATLEKIGPKMAPTGWKATIHDPSSAVIGMGESAAKSFGRAGEDHELHMITMKIDWVAGNDRYC